MEGEGPHRLRFEDPQGPSPAPGDSASTTVTIGSPIRGPLNGRPAADDRAVAGPDGHAAGRPLGAHREDSLPTGVLSTPIVFVVPERLPVPPVLGGAVERWVHEISLRVREAGHPVAVASRPAQPDMDGAVTPADGIERVSARWSPWAQRLEAWRQTVPQRHPLRALAKAVLVADYAWRVRRALRGQPAGVLYVHNDPLLAWLLGSRQGRRTVLHLHNDHLVNPLLRPVVKRLLPRVDKVLFVCDHLRDQAARAFPTHAKRFVTVLNGTDPQQFQPTPTAAPVRNEDITFVYAGRLMPDKGVHVLLEAFARVRLELPHARLVIVGSSFFVGAPITAYERGLRERAAPMGDAVEFTGFLSPPEVARLYASASAVVVPSVWAEPCPLVVLEAMACAACVVASRVGGIPELIDDGRNGVLVPPNAAAELAQALCRVAADAPLRLGLGCAARDTVLARYTWAHVAGNVARELTA